MKLSKKLSLVFVASFLLLGMTKQTSATVHIDHPDKFKVTKAGHDEALKILKDEGIDLKNCPVPIENLTTDEPPIEALDSESSKVKKRLLSGITPRLSRKMYTIDGIDYAVPWGVMAGVVGTGFRNNYLVPTGYVPAENAIPEFSVDYSITSSGAGLWFNPDLVEATKLGGIGTGGWYWRQFAFYRYGSSGNYWAYIWLSVLDEPHLIYYG